MVLAGTAFVLAVEQRAGTAEVAEVVLRFGPVASLLGEES